MYIPKKRVWQPYYSLFLAKLRAYGVNINAKD